MKVILARTALVCSISGADEGLVRYALHLQRGGHLDSVLLLHQPAGGNPYYERLIDSGITVHCVMSDWAPHALLLQLWNVGFGLELIPWWAIGSVLPTPLRAPLRQHALHWVSKLSMTQHVAFARKQLEASAADVVHIVGSDPGTLALVQAARKAHLPILLHELGTPEHPPELRPHYNSLAGGVAHCDEMVALSPRLALGWGRFYKRSVRVLPLLYDDLPQPDRAPARDGLVRLGFAARFDPHKGPMILIEAFARVHAARPQARLIMAGEGPLWPAAKARAAELGLGSSCEFVGYVPESDKPRLFCGFDVFVLPTNTEGTPNAIIEAMIYGRAVVATSVGGIPDLLADSAGLTVPARDVDALVSALLLLVDDAPLREALGRRARERYKRLFQPAPVLDLLLNEYRRLATRGQHQIAGAAHPWFAAPLALPANGSSDRALLFRKPSHRQRSQPPVLSTAAAGAGVRAAGQAGRR